MTNIITRILLCTATLMLAACSANPPWRTGTDTDTTGSAPSMPATSRAARPGDYDSSLMYNLLLGEIAGQQERLDVSVRHYIEAAEASNDPRIAQRAAQIAIYANDNALALRAVERWVTLAPDSLEAQQTLAIMNVRNGNVDAAAAGFDRLFSAGVGEPAQIFMQVALLLGKEGEPQVALAVMDKLVAAHDTEPFGYFSLSQLALHLQEYDRALAAVDRAMHLKPNWNDGYVQRARILTQQGDNAAALATLAKAVQASPKDRILRLNYARLLLQSERMDAARAQFELLRKSMPDDADVLYALALLEIDAQHYDSARRHLNRLLKTAQRVDEAHYYLGRIAETQRDYPLAVKEYSQVGQGEYSFDAELRLASLAARQGDVEGARARLHAMRTDNPALELRLIIAEGEILIEVERYQQAMTLYTHALERFPEDNDLTYARALLAERMDQLDLAESDLKAIIARDPENAHALNALGYTLTDRTTRHQEALDFILRALALQPDDAAIIDSMGWVQYRLGNLPEAEKQLRRAYEMSKDGEVAAHLGEVLWMRGDQAAARKLWDEALKAQPDNKPLRDVIQRVIP